MCTSEEYLLTGSADGMIVEWHIDSNVKSEVFHCPPESVSITTMRITELRNGQWHLFVGTEEGVVHVYEKKYHFVRVASMLETQLKESVLEMAINATATRLMVADVDATMFLVDISALHKPDKDWLLMKEWRPHSGCTTSLLYVAGFDVFCSAADNGELVLWSADGMRLGQFGQTAKWTLFGAHSSATEATNKSDAKKKDSDSEAKRESQRNSKVVVKSKRKSYFDEHSIYRPKLINSVVTESMARTLLEDRNPKEVEVQPDKTPFEQSLEKLVVDLMKPKKRRNHLNRRSSCLSAYSKRSSTLSNFSKTPSTSDRRTPQTLPRRNKPM